jgi:Domain of unknown function (DUF4160)
MPRICGFYGIVILMYYLEHAPPHFHARYAEVNVTIDIVTGEILKGRAPKRALRLIRRWRSQHEDELLQRWEQARRNEPLIPISPLK